MEDIKDYCPICGNKSEIFVGPHRDYVDIICAHCGDYQTTDWGFHSSDFYKKKDKYPVLSYWIRTHQNSDEKIKLNADLINDILNNFSLPKPPEQAENFINLIGHSVKKADEFYIEEYHIIATRIGAYDHSGVKYVADHLEKEGFINRIKDSEAFFKGYLTFDGWAKLKEFNPTTREYKKAFMAMQYNDATLDSIYNNYFKPSLRSLGIELVTLDERLKAGIMDSQLREEISNSHLLLVDLTHGNRGAYWEAGFAEGCKIPVIYLCERKAFKENKTHFDTNHLTTLIWSEDTIDDDLETLKARICTTLPSIVIDKKND